MKKLGFGFMRLPLLNPSDDTSIDLEQVKKMVDVFMEKGFTYFDTAWMYCGFQSESTIKKAVVERYPREAFTVATKLHAGFFNSLEDCDHVFAEQQRKTGVSYFDYYLLHGITAAQYPKFENVGCFDWLLRKKEQGLVKHVGFSFHDSAELLDRILTEHSEMEFVQLQLNYLDWNNQLVQSGKLYEILSRRQIPVIVMEPVKGGTLANLEPELLDMFKAARPDASAASWALRFAGSLDGVVTILSGMSTKEQMEDNLNTFENFEPLTEEENKVIGEVVKKRLDMPLISCTSCRYCCDGCPAKIKIPDVFRALNTVRLYPEDGRPKMFYQGLTADSGKAGDCIACGQCEGVCPQHLPIIELMKEASEKLDA